MRRKRLQHAADNLCQMLCGWRLANSYADLQRLGSGTLTIDVLTAASRFNGQPVPDLSIAGELQAWFNAELARERINREEIVEATVIADLVLSPIERRQRRTRSQYFEPSGRHANPGAFWALDLRCSSQIRTDEKLYAGASVDREEWPDGWPQS